MSAKQLTAFDVLTAESRQRLAELEQLLETALTLSEKELANEALSATELDALRRLPERLHRLATAPGDSSGPSTPLVVTIAEDPTGRWILQQAVGRADLGLFVVRLPDGKLVLTAGPVLTYYEWRRPRAEAITQAEWQRLLAQTPGPSRPDWSKH